MGLLRDREGGWSWCRNNLQNLTKRHLPNQFGTKLSWSTDWTKRATLYPIIWSNFLRPSWVSFLVLLGMFIFSLAFLQNTPQAASCWPRRNNLLSHMKICIAYPRTISNLKKHEYATDVKTLLRTVRVVGPLYLKQTTIEEYSSLPATNYANQEEHWLIPPPSSLLATLWLCIIIKRSWIF